MCQTGQTDEEDEMVGTSLTYLLVSVQVVLVVGAHAGVGVVPGGGGGAAAGGADGGGGGGDDGASAGAGGSCLQ